MQTNQIILRANVNRSQIEITPTHYNIKSIPITVDDAVMNRVHYSAEENAKGMPSMNGNPVTLGHPVVDGQNASGVNGKGLEDYYSGGTIRNVYNNAGVWYADASIKKSVLNAQDGGKEYAELIESRQDIGVSTGLMFEANEMKGRNAKGEDYDASAINQSYDHLAMLANEEPAGGKDTVIRFNSKDTQVFDVNQLITNTDEKSLFKRFMSWFVNETQNEYNSKRENESNNGDNAMRDKIVAALNAAKVETSGLDDDALFAAYNQLNSGDDKAPKAEATNSGITAEQVAEIVANAVKPLQDQLAVNADAELKQLKTQMKAMTVNKLADSIVDKMDAQEMKDHLAANAAVDFNMGGYQHQANADDGGYSAGMPEGDK